MDSCLGNDAAETFNAAATAAGSGGIAIKIVEIKYEQRLSHVPVSEVNNYTTGYKGRKKITKQKYFNNDFRIFAVRK